MKKHLFSRFFTITVLFSVLLHLPLSATAQNCNGMPNAGVAQASPASHTCSGSSSLNLQGSTMAMGLMYQWQYSTDGLNWFPLGSMQPVPLTTTGTITVTTQYRCMVLCTISGMSSLSIPVTVTINPGTQVTPVATITPSTGTTACIDEDITFTSTITNGGSTPTYQWQVNGTNVGTNSDTYTALAGSLSTNDNVSLTVTSSNPCAVPQNALASVTMTVLPLTTPTVSIQATQTVICQGEQVTFTATDNAPGGTYQWYVNGNAAGTGSSNYTYFPTMGDVVSLDFTPPAAGCYDNITVNSNTIQMDVTPGLPTLATISADTDAMEGHWVTVYANLFNFNLSYSIDWYINNSLFATTTVPYLSYIKGPGIDDIFAVASNSGSGCYLSDTSNQISIGALPNSINSVKSKGNVRVFPNPSTNSVQVSGVDEGDQLQLLNVVGQPVLEQKVARPSATILDLAKLPAGNYILSIRSGDGSFKEVVRISKN